MASQPTSPSDSVPCSEDAERGLVASLIHGPSLCLEYESLLGDHLFWNPANPTVFQAVGELARTQHQIDFPQLVIATSKITKLEDIGNKEYLDYLWNFVSSSVGWHYYYEDAFKAYRLRQSFLAVQDILKCSDPDEQATIAEEALKSIAAPQIKKAIPFKERIFQTLDWIEESATTKRESVIRFGVDALDNALQPIEGGDQVVICAETSGGKTALACQAVLSSADKDFAIFSLEMQARSLITRMLAAEGQIHLSNLRSGRLTNHELPRLHNAVERLATRTLWIEDEHPIDVRSIAAKCRVLKHRGLSAVVVDYLQLVAPSGGGKRDASREREVADISRALKTLALELGVVVIALSQLNEQGQLRESRAIGQDADVVLHISEDGIQIRKHRNGPRGKVLVKFDGAYMRFSTPNPKTPPRDPSGCQ